MQIYIKLDSMNFSIAKYLESYRFNKYSKNKSTLINFVFRLFMTISLKDFQESMKNLKITLLNNVFFELISELLDPGKTGSLDFKFINDWRQYLNRLIDKKQQNIVLIEPL